MQKDFFLESPRTMGKESEFFLQTATPNTIACTAHIHSAIELIFVNEGSYTVSLDGEQYELEKGDLILFCSGSVHNISSLFEEKNSYYVIKIPPAIFNDFADREASIAYSMRFSLHRRDLKFLWKSQEISDTRKAILNSLINEYDNCNYASEVARSLYIMQLLLDILRETPPLVEFKTNDACASSVYGVMRYVREHYADNIDEKALARSQGMSYSYFSRSFKRVTGMTFRSYLNRTRINHAEQMLCQNESSVSDIASACGYNSISYFINVYRNLTGSTPYRSKKGRE